MGDDAAQNREIERLNSIIDVLLNEIKHLRGELSLVAGTDGKMGTFSSNPDSAGRNSETLLSNVGDDWRNSGIHTSNMLSEGRKDSLNISYTDKGNGKNW